MSPRLSDLPLEYRILAIYSRDRGQRSAVIGFNVGQGTQDIGFRNELATLFNALPALPLRLAVRDENGAATVAGFTIRDSLNRLYPNPIKRLAPDLFFQPQVYRQDGDTVQVPAGRYSVTASMGPEYLPQTKQIEVTSRLPFGHALPVSWEGSVAWQRAPYENHIAVGELVWKTEFRNVAAHDRSIQRESGVPPDLIV